MHTKKYAKRFNSRPTEAVKTNCYRGAYPIEDTDFDDLLESVQQAGSMKREEQRPSAFLNLNPQKTIGLSQTEFSKRMQIIIKILQNWEQGRRQPQCPALALLTILKKDPNQAKALH